VHDSYLQNAHIVYSNLYSLVKRREVPFSRRYLQGAALWLDRGMPTAVRDAGRASGAAARREAGDVTRRTGQHRGGRW
jgi:hypothetical protein